MKDYSTLLTFTTAQTLVILLDYVLVHFVLHLFLPFETFAVQPVQALYPLQALFPMVMEVLMLLHAFSPMQEFFPIVNGAPLIEHAPQPKQDPEPRIVRLAVLATHAPCPLQLEFPTTEIFVPLL
jgi:hypothetical protein